MSERTCTVSDCDRTSSARGWCGKHYQRWATHGDPETIVRTRAAGPCVFPGCPSLMGKSRGLCHGHYAQLMQRGEMRPKVAQRPKRFCAFPDCGRRHAARGWCLTHYRQARVDPQRMWAIGERPWAHRCVTGHGYVKIWSPDHPNAQKSGYVLEHTAVMSAELGRPIWPDENVHHKNGDRADNRPANLELWSHSQPKGQRVEDKTAWAIEILKRYRPEVLAIT